MKILRFFTLFILYSASCLTAYSQSSNPLYVDNSQRAGSEHWLFSDTLIYDITGSWSGMTNLPDSLFCVNAYYWPANDKVFICGGAKYQPLLPQSVCRWYNLISNQYETAASLPQGRWAGKLVRVRDSLYLVGSVDSSFNTADGLVFRYSLNQNSWIICDTMPLPYVHESAVCVLNDSLILTIGGSTNAFLNPTSITRIYNPRNGTWKIATSYPVNLTSAHADYINKDTVVVLGGYSAGNLDVIYRGFIDSLGSDTAFITWASFGATPFGTGIFRVAGARWNDYLLFGPGMNGLNTVNQIWGFKANGDTTWLNFTPRSLDSAGNISTFGVKSGADSNFFFLFGGYKNPNVLAAAQRYSFATPPPIGIVHASGVIPKSFWLHQNYPNPFNPVTKIKFEIPDYTSESKLKVSLIVYDILGREISTLINGEFPPGVYETDFNGSGYASGIYFCRMTAGDKIYISKMILSK